MFRDRYHIQSVSKMIKEFLQFRDACVIGPRASADEEPVPHPEHVAAIKTSIPRHATDHAALECLGEDLGNRRLLSTSTGSTYGRQEHVAIDDDGLILHEHTIWVRWIRREFDHLHASTLEGLDVGIMLCPCCG